MKIKRAFDHNFPAPKYESAGAAGIDLYYAGKDTYILYPGEARWLPTGWRFEIPSGCVGLVRDRSGWALAATTRAGVIDPDYRGEVKVCLRNETALGTYPLTIKPGDRIAQLIILPFISAVIDEATELSPTIRGENGFGSTGL